MLRGPETQRQAGLLDGFVEERREEPDAHLRLRRERVADLRETYTAGRGVVTCVWLYSVYMAIFRIRIQR